MIKKLHTIRAAILCAALTFSSTSVLANDMSKQLALSGLDVAMGKAMFDRLWTSAPASTDATDGLGPLFNARSCAACHPRGGRSIAKLDEKGGVVRSGVTAKLGDRQGNPDPVYGRQLQSNAVQGLAAEGTLVFDPNAKSISPYRIVNLAYGPLALDTNLSGRLAPTLLGVGLLEMVSDDEILAFADPDDRDGDGISGRPHWIVDGDGGRRLGRFGWKAVHPDLFDQTAAALHFDMGLSSPLINRHEGDCTAKQKDCLNAPHGNSARFDDLEVGADALRVMVAFTANLAPPKAPQQAEQNLFNDIGCAACHRPSMVTEDGRQVAAYTDLLLHDMGPGLDDGVAEGDARSSEWRTAPLWGLGAALRNQTGLMHDGRAKTLEAAIALHDGEALSSRQQFMALRQSERDRLIAFLKSL